jgi:hypothetical protein
MSLRSHITGELLRIDGLYHQGFCSKEDVGEAAIGHCFGLLEDGNLWEKREDFKYALSVISSLMKDTGTEETTELLCTLYQCCKLFESDEYFLEWNADTQCISMEYRRDYSDSVTYDGRFAAHGLWRKFD